MTIDAELMAANVQVCEIVKDRQGRLDDAQVVLQEATGTYSTASNALNEALRVWRMLGNALVEGAGDTPEVPRDEALAAAEALIAAEGLVAPTPQPG